MVRYSKWFVAAFTLALFVGLTEPAFADEAKGKIKSVGKKAFVITDDKRGTNWTYQAHSNIKIILGDKEIKLNELKEGDEVTVTYKKLGTNRDASEVRVVRK